MIETKFKNSEVGMIPEDWEVKTFENICTTKSGGTPSREIKEFYNGSIPWVTTGELNDGDIYDTSEHISESALQNSSAKVFPSGTLLMAMYGATIGKLGITQVDAATNQACCAIFLKEDEQKYVFYKLLFDRPQLVAKGYGAGQPNISQAVIKKLQYAYPSNAEQHRIAEALSDIDDLIATTKKLIEKKRNIKEGAMQDLLFGKRQLFEFTEKWKETNVGSVTGKISRGQMLTSDDFCFGNIPVMAGGKQYAGFHNIANQKGRCLTISGSGASAGFVYLHNAPIFATDCSVIAESNSFSLDFMYYLLSSKQDSLYKMQTGGAQPHVYPRDIESLEILVPSTIEEQKAIASILSDMDSEIQSLEARLTKYQSFKQGMMQQLLTGKIRLI